MVAARSARGHAYRRGGGAHASPPLPSAWARRAVGVEVTGGTTAHEPGSVAGPTAGSRAVRGDRRDDGARAGPGPALFVPCGAGPPARRHGRLPWAASAATRAASGDGPPPRQASAVRGGWEWENTSTAPTTRPSAERTGAVCTATGTRPPRPSLSAWAQAVHAPAVAGGVPRDRPPAAPLAGGVVRCVLPVRSRADARPRFLAACGGACRRLARGLACAVARIGAPPHGILRPLPPVLLSATDRPRLPAPCPRPLLRPTAPGSRPEGAA